MKKLNGPITLVNSQMHSHSLCPSAKNTLWDNWNRCFDFNRKKLGDTVFFSFLVQLWCVHKYAIPSSKDSLSLALVILKSIIKKNY